MNIGELTYNKWKPIIEYKKELYHAKCSVDAELQMMALLLDKLERFIIYYKGLSTDDFIVYVEHVKNGLMDNDCVNRFIAVNYFDKDAPIGDMDYCLNVKHD